MAGQWLFVSKSPNWSLDSAFKQHSNGYCCDTEGEGSLADVLSALLHCNLGLVSRLFGGQPACHRASSGQVVLHASQSRAGRCALRFDRRGAALTTAARFTNCSRLHRPTDRGASPFSTVSTAMLFCFYPAARTAWVFLGSNRRRSISGAASHDDRWRLDLGHGRRHSRVPLA
jgi:hypothetical protein